MFHFSHVTKKTKVNDGVILKVVSGLPQKLYALQHLSVFRAQKKEKPCQKITLKKKREKKREKKQKTIKYVKKRRESNKQ